MKNKICKTCKKVKSIEQFPKTKSYYRNNCKICTNQYASKKRISSSENYLRNCLKYAKYRAKKKNISFELDIDFVLALFKKQKGKCALTGITLTWKKTIDNKYNSTNITIDRINSTKGYTYKNSRLVCYAANVMKSDLTDYQLLRYCELIINYQRYNNVHKTSEKWSA